MELEVQRIKAIKNTMTKFVEFESQVFNIQIDDALFALGDVTEDVSKTMDSSKLLTENELEMLKELAGEGEPLELLINWKLQVPNSTDLIVKEGELSRESGVFRQ